MCALRLTITPVSLLSFLLPYKYVLHAFFSFFYFKPLVAPLFIQLFCDNIYVRSKNEETDLMKTVQLFHSHFIKTLRANTFEINSWKILKASFWKSHFLLWYDCLPFSFLLWMTLIWVLIRHLCLFIAVHCIFLKKCQCLNCNNSYNIYPSAKCMKIHGTMNHVQTDRNCYLRVTYWRLSIQTDTIKRLLLRFD